MRVCKGKGSITIKFGSLPIEANYNENYKDGMGCLEDALCEMVLSILPDELKDTEILDVSISDYEETKEEREVERED